MQAQAFRARPRRRGLPKDDGLRFASVIAPNVLDREFSAERPNRKWIADFTYVWTAEGWLYVAAGYRPVLAACCRLVDEGGDERPARRRRAHQGHLAQRQA